MSSSSKRGGKPNRRADILRAAERLMQARGLSGVTTRQISREVGCLEGALYVHFNGRLELLLAMLEESLPNMLRPLRALTESVGRGSPHKNLVQALIGIFKFHQRIVAETASLFAEPELLAAYRSSLKREGKGPDLSIKVLEDYIRSEQRLKRIVSPMDARLASILIDVFVVLSSFRGAFLRQTNAACLEYICRTTGCHRRAESGTNLTRIEHRSSRRPISLGTRKVN